MRLFKTLTIIAITAAGSLSCSNRTSNGQASSQDSVEQSNPVDEIVRLSSARQSGSISANGHNYTYTITGEPCDSLPIIIDDDGIRYADNLYTLTIKYDDAPFVTRGITKTDLSKYLTPEFQQKGILDGLIYDDRQQGLRFRALVSFPESDVHMPLIISISKEGQISFERDLQAEQDE